MKKSIISVFAIVFACLLFTSCQNKNDIPDSNQLEIQKTEYERFVPEIFEPVEVYLKNPNPKMGEWEILPNLPERTEGGYYGNVENFLMIACGVGGGNNTYVYNLDLGTWATMATAPGVSSEGASATKNGIIYCVGGQSGGNILWAYDLLADTWNSSLQQLPTQRAGLGVAIVDDYLYAIGGRANNGGPISSAPYNTVERYDILNDQWTTVASLPSNRSDLAAMAVGGKIYVLGGFDSSGNPLDDVDVYDPDTDTWSTSPADMPTARGGLYGAGVKGGTIYAIGGWDGIYPFNTAPGSVGTIVEAYKVSLDTWTSSSNFNPMPTAKGEAAVVSKGGSIYFMGGSKPAYGLNIDSFEKFSPSKK